MFSFFSSVPQPDFILFGLRIGEPVTAITCLFITLACWYALQNLPENSAEQRPFQLMVCFFVLLGFSNLWSAFAGHAFQYRLGINWKLPGWISGMAAVGLVAQTAITRLEQQRANSKLTNGLTILNIAAFLFLSWLSISRLDFKMVEIYSAVGLLLLMVPIEYSLLRQPPLNTVTSRWMLLAIIPAVVSVLLHIVKFSASPWFNYFDLGHVLLCVSVYCFFRSTQEMSGGRVAVLVMSDER